MTNPDPHQASSSPAYEVDILGARRVALKLATQVLDERQPLDLALESSSDFKDLPLRDRAFARMLISTTLRRLGQIDDLIIRAQEKPESLKIPLIRNILRLGIAQLFFMEVPDHAAVDTAVKLTEIAGMERQKSFVNAVLRTLTKTGREWIERQDSGRLNTPEWLLKIWIADYGLGQAAKIAASNLNEAPLDITVKNPRDKPYWGNLLKASELSTGTLRRIAGGSIKDMEGFEEGRWWVQDAAAALPAQLFGLLEDTHVIDMCAAPGGKTLQLASMGASVTAIDRSPQRLKKLEQNLARMGLQDKVEIIVSDATVWKPLNNIAPQRILLDAPCTATGTIRRHPDTAWLKTQRDMDNLKEVQARLLNHAAQILGKGGVLIYCTCSLQKDEGEHQIENFLAANPDFQRIPIQKHEIGDYEELINENGDLRILPFHLSSQGGMDGFFVSRITKT